MWEQFDLIDGTSVRWDSTDLVSCKQAALILERKGISQEVLMTLNFGSLDLLAALDE